MAAARVCAWPRIAGGADPRPACRLKFRVAGADPAPNIKFVDSCGVGDTRYLDAVGQGLGNTVVPQPEGTPDAAVSLRHLLAVQWTVPGGAFPGRSVQTAGAGRPVAAGRPRQSLTGSGLSTHSTGAPSKEGINAALEEHLAVLQFAVRAPPAAGRAVRPGARRHRPERPAAQRGCREGLNHFLAPEAGEVS